MPRTTTIYGQIAQRLVTQDYGLVTNIATDSLGQLLANQDSKTNKFDRIFNVANYIVASVQVAVRATTGAATAAVWTVTFGNDGENFFQHPIAGAITLSTGAISNPIDVSAYAFMKLSLTTLSTSTTEQTDISVVCGA